MQTNAKRMFDVNMRHLYVQALAMVMACDPVMAAADDEPDETTTLFTPVEIDFGGVLIEDASYLRGVSRTDNEAQQWQRRRLGFSANLDFGKRISIELDGAYGNADESFVWRDVYLALNLPKKVDLKFGRMKQNFGLARTNSLKNLLTVERPLPTDILALSRATGVTATIARGGFQAELGRFRDHDDDDKPINSVVGRALYTYDNEYYWHLGMSLGKEDYDGAIYRVRSRAETDVMENFLRTEKITAAHVDYLGFEAAWQAGRFLLQGEYLGDEVASPKEGDRRYGGAYLQGSIFLTRDAHSFKDGALQALVPARDFAWELVATHSTLDAFSRNDGFSASTTSAGLNMYFRSHLKLMAELNALRIMEGDYENEEGLAAVLRLQYRF